MLVVTFNLEEFNFIITGDESFFLLQLPGGDYVMCANNCAHRGGPLHLGSWDADKNCLVCPSHQSRYSEKALRKLSIPLILNRKRVTVVLDVPADTRVHLAKKLIPAQSALAAEPVGG